MILLSVSFPIPVGAPTCPGRKGVFSTLIIARLRMIYRYVNGRISLLAVSQWTIIGRCSVMFFVNLLISMCRYVLGRTGIAAEGCVYRVLSDQLLQDGSRKFFAYVSKQLHPSSLAISLTSAPILHLSVMFQMRIFEKFQQLSE